MGLWIVLAGMTVVAALIVVVPMLRSRRSTPSGGAREIAVYADQLAEVDRDVGRGLIGTPEAAAARIEISRRIIHVDQSASAAAPPTTSRTKLVAAGLVVIGIPLLSIALYLDLGSPSLPDQTLAARKATPVEKLSPDDLVARLDEQLVANPNDARGWDIAGPIYLRMARFADAVNAFQQAIRLGGADVRRQTGLGEALTANAQGIVTAEARAAFGAALKIDPHFPLPKMYLALALSQDGKLQESVDAWKQLLGSAQANEPWVPSARRELADVEAKLALAKGETPAPAPGPAAPAQTATAEPDPQPMIESMVARLKERLDSAGGTPDDWGKLMRSYLVLGRADDAKSTYEKARSALSGDATASARLASIATDLGIPQ